MTISTADATFVRTLVKAHAAIVIDEAKTYLIEGRLGPVARDAGAGSIADSWPACVTAAKPAYGTS